MSTNRISEPWRFWERIAIKHFSRVFFIPFSTFFPSTDFRSLFEYFWATIIFIVNVFGHDNNLSFFFTTLRMYSMHRFSAVFEVSLPLFIYSAWSYMNELVNIVHFEFVEYMNALFIGLVDHENISFFRRWFSTKFFYVSENLILFWNTFHLYKHSYISMFIHQE